MTEFAYDSLDRRTAEIWKDGATTVNQIDYTYDKADQLTTASDDWSAYAYTYDDLGRVQTVDNDGTYDAPQVVLTNSYNGRLDRSGVAAEIDGVKDFETTYGYDTLGRVTRVQQTSQTSGCKANAATHDLEG